LGAKLVAVLPVPSDDDQYRDGELFKCIYVLSLTPETG